MTTGEGKELNFELDLLPVISMMSVCICFLLLTAVWTQVGALEIRQGLGQTQVREAATAPSLWVELRESGAIQLTAMDSPSVTSELRKKSFVLNASPESWAKVIDHAAALKRQEPKLKTALIMPAGSVNYGDVIRLMDRLKSLGLGEIGIAPLGRM